MSWNKFTCSSLAGLCHTGNRWQAHTVCHRSRAIAWADKPPLSLMNTCSCFKSLHFGEWGAYYVISPLNSFSNLCLFQRLWAISWSLLLKVLKGDKQSCVAKLSSKWRAFSWMNLDCVKVQFYSQHSTRQHQKPPIRSTCLKAIAVTPFGTDNWLKQTT